MNVCVRKISRSSVYDKPSLKTLIGYPSQINAIAFSPDTKTLVSGGENDGVMLWNLDLDNLIQLFSQTSRSQNPYPGMILYLGNGNI
jgi:WD40 repeat protein